MIRETEMTLAPMTDGGSGLPDPGLNAVLLLPQATKV
jgi:hypothetical protein